jgi:SAM-dependent methyltransferase
VVHWKKLLSWRLWSGKAAAIYRSIDAVAFGIPFAQYHGKLREVVLSGGCESLLDVGCGEHSPVRFFSSEIRMTVGVDAHAPSIEASRAAGSHDEYVQADVTRINEHFAPGSFDCVVSLDVIEHLPKAEGERLLDAMERIARRKVVVFTPNGFLSQPPEPGNPHQEHLSGWTAGEMRRRGYEVTGIAGWRPLRGPYVKPRWRPHALWERVALLTERRYESRADEAFQILCVKRLDLTGK